MSFNEQKWALDPTAVRRRASSIPGCVEVVVEKNNTANNICCFIVGYHHPAEQSLTSFVFPSILSPGGGNKEDDASALARVTIYCDTGTIATGRILPVVLTDDDDSGNNNHDDEEEEDGHLPIRHVFRRNVTNLDVVERCLRNPDRPVEIDWNLIGFSDDDDDRNETEDDAAEVMSPRRNRELLDLGHAMLSGESEKLMSHLQSLNETYFRASPTQHAGLEFQFNLPASPMKHVDQCLHDIQSMQKHVHHVATNGQSTVFLYGNGGVAYTSNIPKNLYQLLVHLKQDNRTSNKNKMRKRPKYIALGTRERYFLLFFDGTFSYKGPKQLDAILSELKEPPRSVSFGNYYDSFFVVFHDGTYQYNRIPDELETKLIQANHRRKNEHNHPQPRSLRYSNRSRKKHNKINNNKENDHGTKLSCVNLGTNGQWFLKSLDGRVGWSGGDKSSSKSHALEHAVQELLDDGHRIIFMDFGDHGSYFVSYD